MSENNKSYRLKCNKEESEYLKLNITQDFDFLDVMSLKITQEDVYKLYTSNYGVVVGRVLANDGFGIPNAKISIFIPNNSENKTLDKNISYPYTTTSDKNNDGIRYNLLPESKQSLCYQNVGTMLSKRDVLDNDVELDVYNNFYKYTTTTNESGDYMIFGVPVGTQSLHVDIDLSDIGVLSQSPRDMIYKGYNLKSFESPNKFKKSTNLDSLPQIISQDTTVFVYPFWGDETQGEIAISKKNINIQYKFEPTCVFMGSIFTDSTKSGISKNCKPSKTSGKMSEMMATQGLIEMIRKTPDGNVEQFDINGGRVINNDGVWCYQIPMNLDYMITDEYGNLIPTDDPTIGIPTRTDVRFRVTIDDNGDSFTQSKTASYLIPNNPKTTILEDYEFGKNCKDESFVNLFWNKVYSVKNYIPRLQIGTSATKRTFLGLKSTNYHESSNPAPYNKLFIDLNLKFKIMCLLSKFYVILIGMINTWVIGFLNTVLLSNENEIPYLLLDKEFLDDCTFLPTNANGKDLTQGEYFVVFDKDKYIKTEYLGLTLLGARDRRDGTIYASQRTGDAVDVFSNGVATICDNENKWTGWGSPKLCNKDDEIRVVFGISRNYDKAGFHSKLKDDLIDCLETSLSSSSEVVNFDFNNDWLNGSLYAPRFLTKTRVNRKTGKKEVKFCGSKNNYSNLHLVNTCATAINTNSTTPSLISGGNDKCVNGECYEQSSEINTNLGNITYNISSDKFIYKSNFTNNGKLFYYHPTDIILLGGLNENDNDGIPKLHQLLPPTSFKITDDVVEQDGNVKLTSGIDWGNDNSEISGGLFASIGCLNSITLIKSCVNAERLCEIGVDYDENYDFTDYNGTTIVTKNVDGFISLDELSEGDSRGMFATLNKNGLKTVNNQYGLKKYDFKYVYPTGFDGKLSVDLTYSGVGNTASGVIDHNYLSTDAKSVEYNKFRFGNDTGGSYSYDASYKLPRYENSFYFYFGLKQGSTALDLFNSQYYVPCSDPEKEMFEMALRLITNQDPCNNTMGSIGITINKYIQPCKIYINNTLYQSNITSEDEITINELSSGYYSIKVVDSNENEVNRNINIEYIPCYSYSSEFIGGQLEQEYNPEYTYIVSLPPSESDYVNEQINN
jgi:hypothetical protein